MLVSDWDDRNGLDGGKVPGVFLRTNLSLTCVIITTEIERVFARVDGEARIWYERIVVNVIFRSGSQRSVPQPEQALSQSKSVRTRVQSVTHRSPVHIPLASAPANCRRNPGESPTQVNSTSGNA